MKQHHNYGQIIEELHILRNNAISLGCTISEIQQHPNPGQITGLLNEIRNCLIENGQEVGPLKEHPSIYQIREILPIATVAMETAIEESEEYVGPLDLVSGSIVAYGHRALSAAKRGSALYTIRRDSDDTTQAFSSDAVTGVADATAISTFIGGGNDGFVSIWNDQSGNDKHATQATTAKQPIWTPTGPNGSNPSLIFTGGSPCFVQSASVTLANSAYTVFAVVKVPTVGSEICGFGSEGADEQFIVGAFGDTAAERLFVLATEDNWNETSIGGEIASAPEQNTFCVLEFAWQLGTTSIKQDGVELYTDDTYDSGSVGSISGAMCIGQATSTAGAGWGADIVELLVYDTLLSSDNKTLLRENLAVFYGITI